METSMVKRCCHQLAKAAGLFCSYSLIVLLPSIAWPEGRAGNAYQLQAGPVYLVNTAGDPGDSTCTVASCSLRAAIEAANASANQDEPDEIHFRIGSGAQVISLTSPLPVITEAVIIDGSTQPGFAGVPLIELNGAGAGEASGLVLGANGSRVHGLALTRFSENGIQVNANGAGNRITGNRIYGNGALGIELGSGGVTANDVGDSDLGANNRQNYPVLLRAEATESSTVIQGRLNSAAATSFIIEFFANAECDPSGHGEGESLAGSVVVTTNENGNASFTETLDRPITQGQFVTATATDPDGNTSEFSQCVPVGVANESWATALALQSPAVVEQYLNKPGQTRWYKIPVFPGSRLTVRLSNLPANYDVTVYKDIGQAFGELNSMQELVQLDAEFPANSFSPGIFSPDVFTPDSFSPDIFSPDVFSPDIFSPDTLSPDVFSPDIFSPDVFNAGGLSPDIFSPDTFSPDIYTPDLSSPDVYNADGAFASAQSRSAVAAGGMEGMAAEVVGVHTGLNSGNYYIRVRGRNGAFDPTRAFRLDVVLEAGGCSELDPGSLPPTSLPGKAGNYRTILVTDMARLAQTNTAGDMVTLRQRLADLAARPEVAGVVVDVGGDDRVAAARVLAQASVTCPYAKNIHAEAIKAVINGYRRLNPNLKYIVLVGNDDVVPFYRYPDRALLAPASNYAPPVADGSAAHAALWLNYNLGQDAYGARLTLSLGNSTLPLPDLAVGRLVETAREMITVLEAYLSTADGIVVPQSSLVSGYDYLADGTMDVRAQLEAGTGNRPHALIAARGRAPAESWTAAELADALLNQGHHDLIYLAGHFDSGSVVAADYETRLPAADVANSAVDMANTVIFSAGGHAGYNVVNEQTVAGVTHQPDWPQAFARLGATLIAGTSYQVGATESTGYAERLYLNFSQQLRIGEGPVAIGEALVAAKQQYLVEAGAGMTGLDERTLKTVVLYGLPMLQFDMPAGRLTPRSDNSIVGRTNGYAAPGAGYELGLRFADVTVSPNMSLNTAPLADATNAGNSVTATFLAGADGRTRSRPAEPILPLEVYNVSAVSEGAAGPVLRGMGFRGGSYTDITNVLPLTGAPAFDIRGLRPLFTSDYFFPVRLWEVNRYEALVNPEDGATRLVLTPAQFVSNAPGETVGTLRRYDSLSFRLFYSNEMTTYPSGNTPALSDPPAVTQVLAQIQDDGSVQFSVRAVGDPAAGIQEVWVTYATDNAWQSLDLMQDPLDTTLWQGTLAAADLAGTAPADMRFMVQAVNGVGLVTMVTNQGAGYQVDVAPVEQEPAATTLTLASQPAAGAFNTVATFSAVLTNNGAPLAGQEVVFVLGSQRRAVTDGNGRATVTIPLSGAPGRYELRAVFAGAAGYAPATAVIPFTITRQATALTVTPGSATAAPGEDTGIVATLTNATGQAMLQRRVFFVVRGSGGWYATVASTNYRGEAALGAVPLPPGDYTVHAYFATAVTLPDQRVITLTSGSYAGSTAAGSLTLSNPTRDR